MRRRRRSKRSINSRSEGRGDERGAFWDLRPESEPDLGTYGPLLAPSRRSRDRKPCARPMCTDAAYMDSDSGSSGRSSGHSRPNPGVLVYIHTCEEAQHRAVTLPHQKANPFSRFPYMSTARTRGNATGPIDHRPNSPSAPPPPIHLDVLHVKEPIR